MFLRKEAEVFLSLYMEINTSVNFYRKIKS